MGQRDDWLAERFEENRSHLRAVAYRMLGSPSEADDALQETWMRLSRSNTNEVHNLTGWLTTVIARVCLDMLRSRRSRHEVPLQEESSKGGVRLPDSFASRREEGGSEDPEQEAILADSVGLALLVVLETLTPSERVAFVLHDMFGVPFEEIAPIVGRSPAATRQLASRGRRRVRGAQMVPDTDLVRQREVVDAFLAAAREGDFEALVGVLDPEVVLRADSGAERVGLTREVRGAPAVARRAVVGRARAARPALVDGAVGVVVVPRGRILMVLGFTIRGGKIVEIDAITDPTHLSELDLAVLDD